MINLNGESTQRKFRNELKFLCTEGQLQEIYYRIKKIMEVDLNGNEIGEYHISSLYFDDYFNTAYYENENGVNNRRKFRIRMYNGVIDNLNLEIKGKINGFTYKDSNKIKLQDYELLIKENIIKYDSLPGNFIIAYLKDGIRPKVIVEYDRIALCHPNGNVRVTFDRNITASFDINQFLNLDFMRYPILQTDCHILEIKFDQFIPQYVKNILEFNFLKQTAFSKYYYARKILGGKYYELR